MILSLRLLFSLACLATIVYGFSARADSDAKLAVLRIDASNSTPRQIGLDLGRQAKALIPDIERRYDAYLAEALSQTGFDDLAQNDLPDQVKALDPALQEELKGVAGAWSLINVNKLGDRLLSLDEYRLLNLLPDFGLSPGGFGFGVMGRASGEAGPIVGSNQEWANPAGLRALQAITVYQYQQRVIVNIGFAGIVSTLTGFNDQGLLLAYFNAEPYSPYHQTHRLSDKTGAITFTLRKMLQTATTGEQTARLLANNAYGFANSILIADKKNVQVLEYSTTLGARLRSWDSLLHPGERWQRAEQIAVVGCHMLAALANNCKDIKDLVRWQRLRELARFSADRPAETSDMSAILFDTANDRYEIFNQKTLQSLIYLPATNSIYLYAAPPAGDQTSVPVHHAYLDLLPAGFENRSSRENDFDLVWLTWLLLIGMLGVVFWVMQQPERASAIRK